MAEGERIAKVLARAGVASRRDAERMIAEGRVSVDGQRIDSPAMNVAAGARIAVDGAPIAAAEPPRLWLYHKPEGVVVSTRDDEGRPTVFAQLPPGMPRVLAVGRLDIASEGLLLLTNDGGIKRRLELPTTGWLRKYRVRIKGQPQDADFAPLRRGIEVEGERFRPMEITLDRHQGANAWATVGLREGRNREVRRAMEAIGLQVNRLIRVSYGPFRLGELAAGAVEEVRARVLAEQLGLDRPAQTGTARPARAARPGRDGTPGGGTPGKAAKPRRDGTPGRDGKPNRDGKPGRDGTPGRDGRKSRAMEPGSRAALPAAKPKARPAARDAATPAAQPAGRPAKDRAKDPAKSPAGRRAGHKGGPPKRDRPPRRD